MKQLDANTLVAYVDGELDSEAAALVEEQLLDDSDARETAAELRNIGVLVRAAHNHVIHETVPDRLVDAILDAQENAPYDSASDDRLVDMILNAPETSETAPPARTETHGSVIPLSRRRSVAAVAMAASFAALLLAGGFYAGQPGPTGQPGMVLQTNVVAAMADPKREAALQEALETKRSLKEYVSWASPESGRSGFVIPVKSYRRQDGTFCREYRMEESHPNLNIPNFGVACRTEDGVWVKQIQAISGP